MIDVVDRVPTYPNRIKITHEDGTSEFVTWERADEPTVEGTPINKALFDSIKADLGAGLSTNKTVYVSGGSGSDVLGDGSSTNPYATIQKAVNSLPKNLNGFDVTIHITDGTYNEDVLVARTFGGTVIFSGTSGANVSIRSLRVSYGSFVRIQNINISVTGAFNNNAVAVTTANLVCLSRMQIYGEVENGIYVNFDGYVYALELNISNTSYAAINATNRSTLYAGTVTGDAPAGMFYRSVNGSLIAYNVSNANAPVVAMATAGGRIYSGAQSSIPNY
jgi:hypothetical protein